MSKCKYAGCMKALDDYGMEFDYLQCMAQTDEIDYKYYGDDYECGFNDDYEDCPIYRLKNKIDKAKEVAKENWGKCMYCETIGEILGRYVDDE